MIELSEFHTRQKGRDLVVGVPEGSDAGILRVPQGDHVAITGKLDART
jgi:hypothetical protein